MPGLQGANVGTAPGSPVKKSRLSLRFFQKKEAKRVLDFSEPPADDECKTEPEDPMASDQVVPGPTPCPASPGPLLTCEKRENLMPFVGLNNLGNTCYLNSILQVLYYCPGLRDGLKKLYSLSKTKDKPKEETAKSDVEQAESTEEALPAHMELLGSFNSLITSVEQLQSSFLLNPDKYSEGELATPPRKILHTLRQLNPMYEGYLQHDAQEVLQCILGYIQDACITIRKEQQEERNIPEVKSENVSNVDPIGSSTETKTPTEEDCQVSGKRKSDTEAGNPKKKPKSVKSKKYDVGGDSGNENKPFTRSKRKSSSDITTDSTQDEEEDGTMRQNGKKEGGGGGEGKGEKELKVDVEDKKKKRARLSWLKPSVKQPSIFSKFHSMGKISSTSGTKNQGKLDTENELNKNQTQNGKNIQEPAAQNVVDDKNQWAAKSQEGLDLMERLFQGCLVLRTRCLECESYTERREDFQDISVPVQEDQPSSPDNLSEVSPDPKSELKTLKWAISQFASVERIVGEDKYFCETCHHYTEAERSLLFDKTPEVITIHLKCFSANGLELDPYAGLSKVNTPLQTPLTLSLEEWCTRPSSSEGRNYQLFAVVMHSGVTISSGHYTTYIRMSDLKDVRLWPWDKKGQEETREGGGVTQQKEEVLRYDDGEVSFSIGERGQNRADANCSSACGIASKAGGKKLSEVGVGLLGGQRSVSSYELSNSSKQADKPNSSGVTETSRHRRTTSSLEPKTETGLRKEPEAGDSVSNKEVSSTGCGRTEATDQQVLNSLLRYEGKWLLFDDSEVRLFEEEDFLRACSPETCSTSTPYLLFYRRMPGPGH
ncbi:ubiquitin carboxyl-terminal hydrolase 1 [Lampris incognitus]|uniref:ubiquitin carboxyl-terminal hydrolase 1 n=1 Tax=Lampris incognitus TaxID=2546036 RepID=UPI0024B48C32|nr:ubiquitin carboxyl-terminal hydrolase 1 [Lampris incognitus]XP_056133170.1 ubiquitin carboxyl-terminal hydrolase 1 [Lampris incognitus]